MDIKEQVTPLTMDEFERGVAVWKTHTTWPGDFHNHFYAQLDRENPNGRFDIDWWQGFLRHLNRWKATRGASGAALTSSRHASSPSWIAL